MEPSYGVEYWSGVESNFFRVAKILITPADSVYLTFSGNGIDLKHLHHILSMLRARMSIRYRGTLLENLTPLHSPILHSKTPLHRIHGAILIVLHLHNFRLGLDWRLQITIFLFSTQNLYCGYVIRSVSVRRRFQ